MAIEFCYDGKNYKLDVTAKTIKVMEDAGVRFADLDERVTGAETLWKGLFIAHHNEVPDRKRMEIYNSMELTADGAELEYDAEGNPVDALLSTVGELYRDAIEKMRRSQGNVVWKRT